MKMMAFDPGFTTGVVIYNDQPSPGASFYYPYQIQDLTPLWDTLHTEQPDQIVYESFYYQRREKVDLRPVEAIGVIRLYCKLNNIIPVAQSAAHGKAFWTDEKIKKIGLWEPGLKHAMDAMRHMLYYQAFQLQKIELLEALK